MTVEELIRALQREDPTAKVGFSYQVGDYWQTVAVSEVVEVTEATVVVEDTGYGYSARLPREDREIDEDDETADMVVLSS